MLVYRDSFKNDILGALDVNMAAIWLTNSDKDTELYKKNGLCGCEDNIEVLLKSSLMMNIKILQLITSII